VKRAAIAALLVALIALVAAACTTDGGGPGSTTTTGAPATTTTTVALASRLCDGAAPQQIGTLGDPALVEASGVVESRAYPGVLWVHNDSGDTARVFAIAKTGATVRQYALGGANAVDWEDIAIATNSTGPARLYLGDIGDNAENRTSIAVYSIDEPDPNTDTRASIPATTLTLTYPDGAHNAEAMFVDPVSHELYIVTKALSGTSEVYRTPNTDLQGAATLVHVGTLQLGLGELVTAGDISEDGSAIALRTYTSVFVWARHGGESVEQALTQPSCDAPGATEHQSEAIAIDPDGGGYVTTSEGANAPIWHVTAG
jgi:hypothetical protein